VEVLSRRIFEEIWNYRNFAVIDELIASDYVHHDPQSPDVTDGIEGYKRFVQRYLTAFPDIRIAIHDEITSGNTVVTRWTASGTHEGDLPGIPRTGRPISVSGITIARTKHGKIVESWNSWDALGMMRQLGAALQVVDRAA
jgi:steroid delta-isomerase-like uncharacterized protein